jgi:hypothetical protein
MEPVPKLNSGLEFRPWQETRIEPVHKSKSGLKNHLFRSERMFFFKDRTLEEKRIERVREPNPWLEFGPFLEEPRSNLYRNLLNTRVLIIL